MSLDFNVRGIADEDVITRSPFDEDKWHPVTTAIVFHSMGCGFNNISVANLDEVWRRIKVWELVCGPSLSNSRGDMPLTREDVELHIGLVTNASTMTKRQFDAKVIRYLNERSGPATDSVWQQCKDLAYAKEVEEEEKAS